MIIVRTIGTRNDGWYQDVSKLGEIEGIDLTLAFLRRKRDEANRLSARAVTVLETPTLRATET